MLVVYPNARAEQGKDELMMHEDAVLALAWSRDSEMLATADQVQAAAADARHGRWGAGSSLACRARRTQSEAMPQAPGPHGPTSPPATPHAAWDPTRWHRAPAPHPHGSIQRVEHRARQAPSAAEAPNAPHFSFGSF